MPRTEKRASGYKPSKETMREKASGRGGYDSYIKPKFKRYKIKDGKNIVRVLPPTWEGANYHALDVWLNYGIGPDNGSYLSLSKHKKGKDPIAEARNMANREGDDDVAKQLAPRERRLMWVIDRMDEDEGPQLFDAPITLDKAFANLSVGDEDEESEGIIDFTDLETGRDIRFYREGKGKNVKYEGSMVKLFKPSALSEDLEQVEEWWSFVKENPVPDCLNFYDYNHIAQVFNGTVSSRDDDDDDKPRKASKPRATDPDEDEEVKPRKHRPVDEDEDKPKPRRRTRDDEDEDEPKSKPKSKAKPPWKDEESDIDTDSDDDDTSDTDTDMPVKTRRRPAKDDDEEEAEPKKGGGLRDRIKARQRSSKGDDDDE